MLHDLPYKPLKSIAHECILNCLKPGDYALDATAGNGYDTLFLAKAVGEKGHVWTIDIQKEAILHTAKNIDKASLNDRVTLIQANHADIPNILPPHCIEKMKAIMFNLGYLPGSDKKCITTVTSTLVAVSKCCEILENTGILSIMGYPGHDGGKTECEHLLKWIDVLDKKRFNVKTIGQLDSTLKPFLIIIEKIYKL